MKLIKSIGIALSLVLLSAAPVLADSPTVTTISKELVCQCGCNMILSNCSHAECSSRETMTTVIRQKLAQGESREQIIQYFVAQYGEQVLASPPKRGFNLTAWLLPFAALIFGGAIVYMSLQKWLKRGESVQTILRDEEPDEEYRHRLEKELEEFTERGFR